MRRSGRWVRRVTEPVERWLSRPGVVWQCGWARVRRNDSRAIRVVTEIMCLSPDPWASHRARRTLEELSADPYSLREVIGCVTAGHRTWERIGQYHLLTPASLSFLLAPAPETNPCPHVPKVRVVGFLSAEQLPFPAPVGTSHQDVADWLVGAVSGAADEGVRDAVSRLLSTTDQPDLLQALEKAFINAAGRTRRAVTNQVLSGGVGLDSLWKDGRPTPLTQIVQANPHLPLDMRDVEPGNYVHHPGVLLAVLKGRLDLVPEYIRVQGAYGTVDALLDGTLFPAPRDFVDRCWQALRNLEPGPARDELCRRAANGYRPARTAVVEAGFVWKDDPVTFLFLTEQWERYDPLDPDGSRLREYCRKHAKDYGDTRRERIEAVASRNGRPNPCPPLPKSQPEPQRHRGGKRSTVGGLHTDPGSGGSSDYGGGDYGGGYSGGGFSF